MKILSDKIVLNRCYGGFGISRAALQFMAVAGHEDARKELEQTEDQTYNSYGQDFNRTDPILVGAVEILHDMANGECAKLSVETIYPFYQLNEHDGFEILDHIGIRY